MKPLHAHKDLEDKVPNLVSVASNKKGLLAASKLFQDNRPDTLNNQRLNQMATQLLDYNKPAQIQVMASNYAHRKANLGQYESQQSDTLSSLSSINNDVVQRGAKYDALEVKAEADYEDEKYEFKDISEEDIIEAVKELIEEYLALNKDLTYYSDEKMDLEVSPIEDWEIHFENAMRGGAGFLMLPPRENVISRILNDTFTLDLAHELGHGVRGIKEDPEWQAKIREELKDVKNANHKEELRADMTGIGLRYVNGEDPNPEEYAHLLKEPESNTHPAGALRIEKIKRALELL